MTIKELQQRSKHIQGKRIGALSRMNSYSAFQLILFTTLATIYMGIYLYDENREHPEAYLTGSILIMIAITINILIASMNRRKQTKRIIKLLLVSNGEKDHNAEIKHDYVEDGIHYKLTYDSNVEAEWKFSYHDSDWEIKEGSNNSKEHRYLQQQASPYIKKYHEQWYDKADKTMNSGED